MLKFNYYYYWSLIILFFSMSLFYFFVISSFYDMTSFIEISILYSNSVSIVYLILFDWVSLLFMSLVLLISSMVVLYSVNYMGVYNYSSNRFLFLVVMFVVSMLLMIISPNLISILLGWDGLGLVSYCLVIYYSSVKSYLAGMLTCLINRLGDIGLLISISWMFSYGSWHFMFYMDLIDNSIFYLVIISSFTKSAQIPFSMWLPAAMAAPTPVSSLVHSSTLVTAGVYLLIRFFNKFLFMNYFFLMIGLLTMFMSSFCANYEFDLKKIIALSTLSQLGLMMVSLFLGLVNLTYFHLLSHAMFKSLLFLCSGIFIYNMNDNQDIRLMGRVCNMLPFTCASFNVASLTLMGFPFLSGFYSKDLIVELGDMHLYNLLYFCVVYMCLGLTVCYSLRLFYYSMIFEYKFFPVSLVFEDLNLMKLSIFILTMFSIFFGCMFFWVVLIDLVFIFMSLFLKLLSFIFLFLGLFVGYNLFKYNSLISNLSYYLFSNLWFMYSYFYYFYLFFYNFSYSGMMLINWGEYYGGLGFSFMFNYFSNLLQNYFTMNLKIMFISFLFWLMFLI